MKLFLIISTITMVAITYAKSSTLDTLFLTAPDKSEVRIIRDEYGVPHIFADNEKALFFGQGFAQANDRLLQLATYRMNALGRLSEFDVLFGSNSFNADLTRRQTQYTVEEYKQLLENMPPNFKDAIHAFADGINRYLDSIEINPDKYQYSTFDFIKNLGIVVEKWEPYHSAAIMVTFARIFGAEGGDELYNLMILEDFGEEDFNKYFPINDPKTFTTVQDHDISAIELPQSINIDIQYDRELIKSIKSQRESDRQIQKSFGLPEKFGSFAVLTDMSYSSDNTSLLLGCPQMGEPNKGEMAPINEVELSCPGFHVGGVAATGVPFVIIGRNEKLSWTFTSGLGDNIDTYISELYDVNNLEYKVADEILKPEIIFDTIKVQKLDGMNLSYEYIPITINRTIYGPIKGISQNTMQIYSEKMSFWLKELNMFYSLYRANKAITRDEYIETIKHNPMSFNVFLIDEHDVLNFYYSGLFPIKPEGTDPRFPLLSNGHQEWQGFIDFEQLPKQINPPKGYFVNWNNKPAKDWDNGDRVRWTSNNYQGTLVLNIYDVVDGNNDLNYHTMRNIPNLINGRGTYEQLVQHSNNSIINQVNALPPGQSEFQGLDGIESKHASDQWEMYLSGNFKQWYFGNFGSTTIDKNITQSRDRLKVSPNPFVFQSKIEFELLNSDFVFFEIFDSEGNIVYKKDYGHNQPGNKVIFWSGEDNKGRKCSAGAYYFRIYGSAFSKKGQILLIN
ncbi:MAG: penicillin acylase family protein [Candidatus Kapaibacterium sp.]|jgi:penicillin amidase|nr:penicillin acylase family protein [Candidatus Kapabacteria bacterium]